jgi:hypothetical protein
VAAEVLVHVQMAQQQQQQQEPMGVVRAVMHHHQLLTNQVRMEQTEQVVAVVAVPQRVPDSNFQVEKVDQV